MRDLNELDPLPKLGNKLEAPRPCTQQELDECDNEAFRLIDWSYRVTQLDTFTERSFRS